MINLYKEIQGSFGKNTELCGVTFSKEYLDHYHLMKSGEDLYKHVENGVLQTRKQFELHYYNYLEHQLFSRLQEIKSYSTVNIFNTRRLVSVTPDCISLIQLLVRDEIHLLVHFRSSHFTDALPCDLEFLSSLPHKLIRHLITLQGTYGYDEINEETIKKLSSKKVKLTLTFGSLHLNS